MYFEIFAQMKKELGQLNTWLDKTNEYAKSKSIDPNLFLAFRLSPDQFALARQVQTTCDTAKLGLSRLTGKAVEAQPDTEATIEELRARVNSVIALLDGVTAKDFAETATRVITQPRWEGKTMTGADYFIEHVTPNFFFHLMTTYAILRHNGVPIGKRDYLGAMTQKAP